MNAFVPYGAYWSTPFARWQGSLAHLHSLRFAAWTAQRALSARNIDPAVLDFGVLGTSVPQEACFYGLPWVAGLLGAPQLAGPTIAQACATSARCLALAAQEVSGGTSHSALVLTADRVSNGPQLYYPDPSGPGGQGVHERWVLDNFGRDPLSGLAMVDTAERVAQRYNIGRAEQDAVTLRRYEQYAAALADDHAFLRRFMELPFPVPDARLRKTVTELAADEGVHTDTNAAGLAALQPVREGGTITYGGQTHPADGNAGMVVCDEAQARALSRDAGVRIRLRAFAQSRTDLGYMPEAPIGAARLALQRAGVEARQLVAIKTHNPFVVADLALAQALEVEVMNINNYGCSLVWGHPQGPTGLRAVIELIEELVMRGGGLGLFTGCAAGDSAMAVVVEVGDARGSA